MISNIDYSQSARTLVFSRVEKGRAYIYGCQNISVDQIDFENDPKNDQNSPELKPLKTRLIKPDRLFECFKSPWLGLNFVSNAPKTHLFVLTRSEKLKIFINFFEAYHPLNAIEIDLNQRANIHTLLPFSKNRLFVITKNGMIFLYNFDIRTRRAKLVSHKWLRMLVSAASVCPEGKFLALALTDNYSKLDRILAFRITEKEGNLILPKFIDFKKTKYSSLQHSFFSGLQFGFSGGRLVLGALQLKGHRCLFLYCLDEQRIQKVLEKEGITSGNFFGFGRFGEPLEAGATSNSRGIKLPGDSGDSHLSIDRHNERFSRMLILDGSGTLQDIRLTVQENLEKTTINQLSAR